MPVVFFLLGAKMKLDAAKATSLAFRIATMGLALSSAIVMATSTQCITGFGAPGFSYTVSSKSYGSLMYMVIVNTISAGIQAVAIFLSVHKKCEDNKAVKAVVELFDVAVLGLLFSSTGAAIAVLTVASVGLRSPYFEVISVCRIADGFCRQVVKACIISMAAAFAVSVTVFTKHVECPSSSSPLKLQDKEEESCGHGCHCQH